MGGVFGTIVIVFSGAPRQDYRTFTSRVEISRYRSDVVPILKVIITIESEEGFVVCAQFNLKALVSLCKDTLAARLGQALMPSIVIMMSPIEHGGEPASIISMYV